MSGDLNKIFSRDFVIGFFLPALSFLIVTVALAKVMWPSAAWLDINWRKPLEDTGTFVLSTWVLAVFLQSINRELFRIAEGYWPFGLKDRLNHWEIVKFRKLNAEFEELFSRIHNLDPEQMRKLTELSRVRARKFPSTEDLVLPTSFGNVVRAYEDYSRVVYGFESINGWPRLQGVMSKDFRENLSNDRAKVDLWLNLCFLAVISVFEIAVVAKLRSPSLAWLTAPVLAFAWVAYVQARTSVWQYGEQIKAAFDIYLPALAASLGYRLSANPEKNMKFWQSFGQVMVHRDAGALEEMSSADLTRVGEAQSH